MRMSAPHSIKVLNRPDKANDPKICDICKTDKTGSICSYAKHEGVLKLMCVSCYMKQEIEKWPEYWKRNMA